ncbi:GNAT family N-acetyltransferase [Chroococcidiopsis thermalis]|uniref:GCN5-related N-acetyltransferase n=1 Tax=Chroococcidiopsis thermalis (strain PCC 7203) TaxID=251229 RepID=K9U7E3_CHRTP|nr:GNAT family N-acetyltransferase [Chroococcidiopsis thermalis]AFY90331.1 GCN5-related N-acetyltransferase [Chroococcidiopsis thermalis PCC 7203]PSB43039.1 N-acetyltransferase [Cyanosarcina cf. burmensis CCALA 770]
MLESTSPNFSDELSNIQNIQIITYQSQYQAAIIKLILNIQQQEFGLPITLKDQRDLLDIPNFYQQGNGNFWIALYREKVIGTIAAIDMGDRQLALRKMFVDPNYRGKHIGVGQNLLHTLLNWARNKNICDIYLGTVDVFQAAHRFYEKNGFTAISRKQLPVTFPTMAGDTTFYQLKLK